MTSSTPRTSLSHADIRTIVVGVGMAMFLGALDQTIIAAALPAIASDLGGFDAISWIASIYLLTATAVTPLYGKFSDIKGRRAALTLAVVTFVAGSIACALAPSMGWLIAARALQGLGGGGLIALAQTIVADIVAPKERGRYQIYFVSVFLLSSLLGPTLGGFFTQHLHWTLIFWINLPLGALAFFMSNSALKRLPRHDRAHRLDLIGAVLLIAATVTLMLALHDGGTGNAWTSPRILGLLAGSATLWLAFVWRIRTAREPLIPLSVLGNDVVARGTVAASCGMGAYIGLSIYLPVYFQSARGMSTTESGFGLLPLMVGTVIGAIVAGQLMGRIVHYKRVPVIGLFFATLGALSLTLWADAMPLALFAIILAMISIGLGTVLPTTTVAIQNAVEMHQMGTATGTVNFFRQLASAVTVAVFGALLNASGVNEAPLDPVASVPAGDFRPIFAATTAGFVIALVFMLWMKEKPLRSDARHAAEAVFAD
jgi:EmrB/QacA subfamily drug resistance transporter